jgi:hypothetical protein
MKTNPSPLKRVDLVCVPVRGKPRIYAINPLTVGNKTFGFVVAMMELYEQEVRDNSTNLRYLSKNLRRMSKSFRPAVEVKK